MKMYIIKQQLITEWLEANDVLEVKGEKEMKPLLKDIDKWNRIFKEFTSWL